MDYSKKIKKKTPPPAPGDYRKIPPQSKTSASKSKTPLGSSTQQRARQQAIKQISEQKSTAGQHSSPTPSSRTTTQSRATSSQRTNNKKVQQRSTQSKQTSVPTQSRKRNQRSKSAPFPQHIKEGTYHPTTPPPKRRKSMPKWIKRCVKLLLIALVVFLVYFAFQVFGNLNKDLSSDTVKKYGISNTAADVANSHRVVNVAVFGVDGREDVDGERSDSIMIASADFESNGIKVTSLMRDTYVYIEEEDDFDKLNAAYSLGGPDLALKTINQNFDTAITDYVTVDFTCLVEMVNAVGGVTVNIESDEELYWVNQYLMDVNDKVKTTSPDVAGIGEQVLDGSQALAYCRVRYVGNGDFDRTQRQRTIFQQVVTKALGLNPLAQLRLLQSVMPYVQTSMSSNEIMKYAGNVILMGSKDLQQMQMPTEGFVETGYLGDISYVFPITLVDNIKSLYQFIYGVSYTPSSTAQDISDDIERAW